MRDRKRKIVTVIVMIVIRKRERRLVGWLVA